MATGTTAFGTKMDLLVAIADIRHTTAALAGPEK